VAGLSLQDQMRLCTIELSYCCPKHGIFYHGALQSVLCCTTKAKASTWFMCQCCSEYLQYFSICADFSAGLSYWQEMQTDYYLQSLKNTAILQSKSWFIFYIMF